MDAGLRGGDDSATMTAEELGRVFAKIELAAAKAAASDPRAEWSPNEMLRRALSRARQSEPDVETIFSLQDASVRLVFVTLCDRCGINVYRRPRQRKTSRTIQAPQSFVDAILWPMTMEMTRQLDSWFLDQVMTTLRTWETESPRKDSRSDR